MPESQKWAIQESNLSRLCSQKQGFQKSGVHNRVHKSAICPELEKIITVLIAAWSKSSEQVKKQFLDLIDLIEKGEK